MHFPFKFDTFESFATFTWIIWIELNLILSTQPNQLYNKTKQTKKTQRSKKNNRNHSIMKTFGISGPIEGKIKWTFDFGVYTIIRLLFVIIVFMYNRLVKFNLNTIAAT